MAGNIRLQPEDLKVSAAKYTDSSEQIDQILNALTTEQSVIQQNWEGDAFGSFDAQFNELKPKIQEFSELLQSINRQLHSVAQIMEEADQQMANAIRKG